MLVESSLITIQFLELYANSLIIHFQNSDANICHLLLLTLVLRNKLEFNFIFVLIDFWLNFSSGS